MWSTNFLLRVAYLLAEWLIAWLDESVAWLLDCVCSDRVTDLLTVWLSEKLR